MIPRDRWVAFLVTPATVRRWQRELVRRKWAYRRTGRTRAGAACASEGELRKLGSRVGATTIRSLLRTARLGPAPRRSGPTWTEFRRAQAAGIIACDCCTVETAWLRTRYVLLCIELGSRRIFVRGSTAQPDSAWVTQQARNRALDLDDRSTGIRCLSRDRDTTFSRSFDAVIRSEVARVILTPVQAPNANAYAERVIETSRVECLDWSLVQRSAPPRSHPTGPTPRTTTASGPSAGSPSRRH